MFSKRSRGFQNVNREYRSDPDTNKFYNLVQNDVCDCAARHEVLLQYIARHFIATYECSLQYYSITVLDDPICFLSGTYNGVV